MPDKTVPAVQPLEGKTSIDEKMLFEPERLSYVSAVSVADYVADQVTSRFANTASGKVADKPTEQTAEKQVEDAATWRLRPVVVSDLDLFSDLANAVVMKTLLNALVEDYSSLRERAEGAERDTESRRFAARPNGQKGAPTTLGIVPPLPVVPAVTAGLNTMLGVASLFREDVSFSGVKTAVDDLALQIEVAGRLRRRGFKSVLIPTFFIIPSGEDGEDSLRVRLKSAEDAKMAVWQAVAPKISSLVDLDTKLDHASRNKDQSEVDRLTQELNALRADLSPITEPLAKLDQQFNDILAGLIKQDPATGLTGLARLLRAEGIRDLDPIFLHVKVVSSGGHNKVTRSLFRTLFTGDGLSFMGGLVVRWALLDDTGTIQDGGIAATRHAGKFPHVRSGSQ